MFNEVYHLTEAYCSGCNAHDDVINEESVQFPLLQKLPVIAAESSSSVLDIMEYAEKMLVLTGNDHIELIQFMVNAGIGCVVSGTENGLSDAVKNCGNTHSTCMMMYEKEFLEFCSKAQYYLTGSILIVLPRDEYMIQRLLDAAYKLCRDCQVKVVFVSEEDTYLSKRGKRLSELIEGPCKQSYLILKGE
jgi:ATP-dependent DNA helicase RecQ